MVKIGESPMRRNTLVLMSGGIDSAACVNFLLDQGLDVTGVFIDYGQAAAGAERQAANSMAAHLGVHLQIFTVAGSDSFGRGELVGRNAFLVFTALFLARAHPEILAAGLHAGTPYYDSSIPFVESIKRLVAEHTDGRCSFTAPFISWSKSEVYAYFQKASLPIVLTYSCEAGTVPPCGACASCHDRRKILC